MFFFVPFSSVNVFHLEREKKTEKDPLNKYYTRKIIIHTYIYVCMYVYVYTYTNIFMYLLQLENILYLHLHLNL